MFLKGECADFPDSWSDRMWGPDDLPNQRTQYELRRAAVRICEACPVRAECLAFGIMVRDQYGIYGGLPLRARRQVLKTCPLRTTCIADSLVGGWKDRNLIGGLDYRRRTVLSKLVCRDLGITARQLHDMPAQRVSDWLERHPDWADRTRLADSSDWRQRKRLQRRKRERLSVAPSFTDATPVPPAIQGVLF